MADGKFSNFTTRPAKDFSLEITDKGGTDITIGAESGGYYPLSTSLTGKLTAGTWGRFHDGTATDNNVIVGRMIAAASSGGGLSTTANYTGTPTVTITPTNTVGGTEVTEANKGTYYVKIVASSAKLTGTTTVKRAAFSATTAGYQPKKTLLGEGSQNANVTVNSGTSTKYINIPAGSCTVAGGGLTLGTASGGGLSGGGLSVTGNKTSITPTISIALSAQNTTGVGITDNKPSSGYYLTIGGSSSSDSAIVNRAKVDRAAFSQTVTRAAITDAHTAGYIPAKSATTVINSDSKTVTLSAGSIAAASQTITVNAGSKTRYITIPSAVYANGFVNSAGYIPTGTNVYTTAQTDECITINFN